MRNKHGKYCDLDDDILLYKEIKKIINLKVTYFRSYIIKLMIKAFLGCNIKPRT